MRREYLPAKLLGDSVFFLSFFFFFFFLRNVRLLFLMIMNKIVSHNFLKGKAKWKEKEFLKNLYSRLMVGCEPETP